MTTTRTSPNPDISPLNPDNGLTEMRTVPAVRDGWVRIAGTLFFGLLIPRLTDLLGRLEWRELNYWAGTIWFLLAAAALWEGNRLIILKLRAAMEDYQRLLLRLLLITGACVIYTIPVTIASVALWQYYIGAPFPTANWAVVSFITTDTVIAAVFVAQAYEMLFLQKERERDQLRLARLERARLLSELHSLQGQLAPHFLFNCLNTLAALIEEDPKAAAAFNSHLSDVSRYLLRNRDRDLVPLADELAFIHAYIGLMELRFPKSLEVKLVGFDQIAGLELPPASLQLLVENAIKHNRFDSAGPLRVDVAREADTIVVTNPLRPKTNLPSDSGSGLRILRERVQLLAGRELGIHPGPESFRVRLPLVKVAS